MNYNYDNRRDMVIEPAQLEAANDIYHPTIDQRYMLGCKLEFNDGRLFRYCENGTPALAKALMTQGEIIKDGWVDESQATNGVAAAIGDKSITVALTTALAAHDLDNGWLCVRDGTGQGELYGIKSHTIGTAPVIQLSDEGGIRAVTVASALTQITLIKNSYKDVVVVPAAAGTQMPTGVPLTAVTGDYFFWAQRKGECPMMMDWHSSGVLVAGNMCGEPVDGADNGAVGILEADGTLAIYGWVKTIAANEETAIIYLTLE